MWCMGPSFCPGKGELVLHLENSQEIHMKASTLSVIRGELRDVLTAWQNQSIPMGPPKTHWLAGK